MFTMQGRTAKRIRRTYSGDLGEYLRVIAKDHSMSKYSIPKM
jgi:hypothetical protein